MKNPDKMSKNRPNPKLVRQKLAKTAAFPEQIFLIAGIITVIVAVIVYNIFFSVSSETSSKAPYVVKEKPIKPEAQMESAESYMPPVQRQEYEDYQKGEMTAEEHAEREKLRQKYMKRIMKGSILGEAAR